MSNDTKSIVLDTLELKAEDERFPGGLLEGYASVFNNVDHHMDVMMPGSFKKTIRESKGSVPILDSHRASAGTAAVIGRTIELKEDQKGLWFRGYFSQTQLAQEIRQKIREGVIRKMSFGYRVIKDRMRSDGVREIMEGQLFEISPVVFPANDATSVSVSKWNEMNAEARAAHMVCNVWLPQLQEALISTKAQTGKARTGRIEMGRTLEALSNLNKTLGAMSRVADRLRWERAEQQGKTHQPARETKYINEYGIHQVKSEPVRPPLIKPQHQF